MGSKINTLDFQTLWRNHPTITGDDYSSYTDTKSNNSNQCTKKLVTCLARSGVNTNLLPGMEHYRYSEHEAMGAEELSTGLTRYHIAGIQKVRKIKPENFSAGLHGKTGIIFFKDYWHRTINGKTENFRNKSGDHIDLWNGSKLTSLDEFHHILQSLNLGPYNYYTNDELGYNKTKTIWFWRVS